VLQVGVIKALLTKLFGQIQRKCLILLVFLNFEKYVLTSRKWGILFAMTVHSCPNPVEAAPIAELGSWVFSAEPTSVVQARSQVAEILRHHQVHSTDDAEIVTDELVANAVVHAKTDFTLILERWCEGIRITVQDGSAKIPEKLSPDPLAESGRGLVMIAQVAHSWGHHLHDRGKCVWAYIPVAV